MNPMLPSWILRAWPRPIARAGVILLVLGLAQSVALIVWLLWSQVVPDLLWFFPWAFSMGGALLCTLADQWARYWKEPTEARLERCLECITVLLMVPVGVIVGRVVSSGSLFLGLGVLLVASFVLLPLLQRAALYSLRRLEQRRAIQDLIRSSQQKPPITRLPRY